MRAPSAAATPISAKVPTLIEVYDKDGNVTISMDRDASRTPEALSGGNIVVPPAWNHPCKSLRLVSSRSFANSIADRYHLARSSLRTLASGR
jgi:hypothetical protein